MDTCLQLIYSVYSYPDWARDLFTKSMKNAIVLGKIVILFSIINNDGSCIFLVIYLGNQGGHLQILFYYFELFHSSF